MFEPKIMYLALAMKVLAVATTRVEGRWCAYINSVEGNDHDYEWQEVLRSGDKLPEKVANVIFAGFSELLMQIKDDTYYDMSPALFILVSEVFDANRKMNRHPAWGMIGEMTLEEKIREGFSPHFDGGPMELTDELIYLHEETKR